MKVAHVALWTTDLDRAVDFWQRFFRAEIGPLYCSTNQKGFSSRFIRLGEGPSIELMTLPALTSSTSSEPPRVGWAHVAVSLGSEEAVNQLAERMEIEKALVSGPRWTGDGFYEAVIRDPDGNLIEITI